MTHPKVFISYTNIDKKGGKFASGLWEVLREDYDTFFWDHSKKNNAGQNLKSLLARAVAAREIMLVVCTEAIRVSDGADDEFNLALLRGKLVIPLKYDDVQLPDALDMKIFEPFDDNNCISCFHSLAKSLPGRYEKFLLMRQERENGRNQFKKEIEERVPPPSRIAPSSAKSKQLLQTIVRAYHEESVVDKVSMVRPYDDRRDSGLKFAQIGIRVPISRELADQTNRVVTVDELGASIALGERNYLHTFWLENTKIMTFPSQSFSLSGFQDALQQLSAEMSPAVLLAPIEKYVALASWSRDGSGEGGIKWERHSTKFAMRDGRELRIFWSNKYAPLNEFILIDPAATLWIVKPDEETGDRLNAFFVQNANDPATKVDFYIKTVVSATLADVNRVKVFAFEATAAKEVYLRLSVLLSKFVKRCETYNERYQKRWPLEVMQDMQQHSEEDAENILNLIAANESTMESSIVHQASVIFDQMKEYSMSLKQTLISQSQTVIPLPDSDYANLQKKGDAALYSSKALLAYLKQRNLL